MPNRATVGRTVVPSAHSDDAAECPPETNSTFSNQITPGRIPVGPPDAFAANVKTRTLQELAEKEAHMRAIFTLFIPAVLTVTAFAQDWYQDREQRFRGEEAKSHLFQNVRTDLEHVWSDRAHEKEVDRIVKTEQELTKMQADLDKFHWDNGLLNDVIDSIKKSANDERLSRRDRDILADDLIRLKDFQDMHNR